jgi:Mrp family chromosome partitioning ATPase/capsular polysaccharide biosynthesis protein
VEPVEYLRILRRRWGLVVGAVLVAATVAWVTTPAPTELPASTRFQASHTLFREGTGDEANRIGLPLAAVLATRGEVPRRVVERLGLDVEPAVLASQVTVTPGSDVPTLTISSTDRDGEQAALIANTLATELVAYLDERAASEWRESVDTIAARLDELEQEIRDRDATLRTLDTESVEAELVRAERDSRIRQYSGLNERFDALNDAGPPTAQLVTLEEAVPIPTGEGATFEPPRSARSRVALGLLLGLLGGVVLALVLERVDTRVRTRRGAEHAFGLPVVAEIPRLPYRERQHAATVVATEPTSAAAESYRILRSSLERMPRWILPVRPPQSDGGEHNGNGVPAPALSREGPTRVILVTSAGPGEGKTSAVANLAACFAEAGREVVVLDCDLRHPQLHVPLGGRSKPGVSDYLAAMTGRGGLRPLVQETRVRGVSLVAGGTRVANPAELTGVEPELVEGARDLADIVLIDAGPVLTVNDPAALIPLADAVLIVARSGHTTAETALRTSEVLAGLQAPLVGVALIGVPPDVMSRRSGSGLPAGGDPRRLFDRLVGGGLHGAPGRPRDAAATREPRG